MRSSNLGKKFSSVTRDIAWLFICFWRAKSLLTKWENE